MNENKIRIVIRQLLKEAILQDLKTGAIYEVPDESWDDVATKSLSFKGDRASMGLLQRMRDTPKDSPGRGNLISKMTKVFKASKGRIARDTLSRALLPYVEDAVKTEPPSWSPGSQYPKWVIDSELYNVAQKRQEKGAGSNEIGEGEIALVLAFKNMEFGSDAASARVDLTDGTGTAVHVKGSGGPSKLATFYRIFKVPTYWQDAISVVKDQELKDALIPLDNPRELKRVFGGLNASKMNEILRKRLGLEKNSAIMEDSPEGEKRRLDLYNDLYNYVNRVAQNFVVAKAEGYNSGGVLMVDKSNGRMVWHPSADIGLASITGEDGNLYLEKSSSDAMAQPDPTWVYNVKDRKGLQDKVINDIKDELQSYWDSLTKEQQTKFKANEYKGKAIPKNNELNLLSQNFNSSNEKYNAFKKSVKPSIIVKNAFNEDVFTIKEAKDNSLNKLFEWATK